jgi:hypothetical protein
MPLRFNRKVEQQHYIDETNIFIKAELRHARRQVQAFSHDDSGRPTNPRDLQFAESAERYLGSLETAFDVAMPPPESGGSSAFRSRFLKEFPQFIYYLATAVYQRLEDLPYRFFTTRAPESRFAPSEVALEYAVTIRAAEAVSGDYHDRLRSFYPPATECRAPLVTLSGGPVAELYVRLRLCQDMLPETAAVPITPKALIDEMRHCQNLSCIKLPRWSSQHIRTYALAAHEHMHRVLNNALLLSQAAKKRFASARKDKGILNTNIDYLWFQKGLEKTAHEDLYDEHLSHFAQYEADAGKALATFGFASYEFFQELWRFYRDEKRAAKAAANPGADVELTTAEVTTLRNAAHRHSVELLADIGAILIAGPAFVFAFRTVHPISDREHGVAPDNHSHPSTSLRVGLHIDLLRRLGFTDIATLLEDDLQEEWAELGDKSPFEVAYEKFLSSTDGIRGLVDLIVKHFTEHITTTAGASSTYNLERRREDGVPLSTESELIDRWISFAHQVEDERNVLAADVTEISPADTINAIWWKRIEEQSHNPHQQPRNRLAWRVALRNQGRLDQEQR